MDEIRLERALFFLRIPPPFELSARHNNTRHRRTNYWLAFQGKAERSLRLSNAALRCTGWAKRTQAGAGRAPPAGRAGAARRDGRVVYRAACDAVGPGRNGPGRAAAARRRTPPRSRVGQMVLDSYPLVCLSTWLPLPPPRRAGFSPPGSQPRVLSPEPRPSSGSEPQTGRRWANRADTPRQRSDCCQRYYRRRLPGSVCCHTQRGRVTRIVASFCQLLPRSSLSLLLLRTMLM